MGPDWFRARGLAGIHVVVVTWWGVLPKPRSHPIRVAKDSKGNSSDTLKCLAHAYNALVEFLLAGKRTFHISKSKEDSRS